jgi:hypothetical protein
MGESVMQSGKLSRRINLITAIVTAVLAVAAFAVLSVTRSKLLNDESAVKKAAGDYSDLRRAYSRTGDKSAAQELPASPVSLSDDH